MFLKSVGILNFFYYATGIFGSAILKLFKMGFFALRYYDFV
ncbi:membrane protein [Helicobacter pylori]|nr:membrane protein [Helicobacter pylori]